MSINHYSSDSPQSSRSLWWTQQHQQPITTSGAGGIPIIPLQPSWHRQQPTFLNSHNPCFNLNNQVDDDDDDVDNTTITTPQKEEKEKEDEDEDEDENEAMFEKALTPSDVGKLNRLVIPKQHAEKYFPLGGDSAESKGLLLSFEDESGKCWRFRYSYWNSSQSYVLTKGWSRYVKDKRLDAGDVVLFQRHRVTANRLFIRWRRRHSTTAPAHISKSSSTTTGGGGGFYSAHQYPMHHHHHHPFPYQPNSLHAGGGSQSQGEKQTTQVGKGSSSRVLRLFGVNMECQPQPDNDSQTLRPECSSSSYNNNNNNNISSSTHHFYHHQPS